MPIGVHRRGGFNIVWCELYNMMNTYRHNKCKGKPREEGGVEVFERQSLKEETPIEGRRIAGVG